MANWIYICKTGKELRELINTDSHDFDNADIMRKIADCYNEIGENYPSEDDDFQEQTDEYAAEIYTDIDEAESFGYIDNETVNYHLENLYDLCDNLRIWIEI